MKRLTSCNSCVVTYSQRFSHLIDFCAKLLCYQMCALVLVQSWYIVYDRSISKLLSHHHFFSFVVRSFVMQAKPYLDLFNDNLHGYAYLSCFVCNLLHFLTRGLHMSHSGYNTCSLFCLSSPLSCARVDNLVITCLHILQAPKAALGIKDLKIDISKTGGLDPVLNVQVNIIPLFVQALESDSNENNTSVFGKLDWWASGQYCSAMDASGCSSFLFEDISLSCDLHQR